MDITKILDGIKLPTRYLFSIAVATGFVLFAPIATLNQLGLTATVNQFRGYIGGIFILAASLVSTSWLIAVYQSLSLRAKAQKNIKRLQERLHKLTPDEAAELFKFINEQTRTQYFSITDGVIGGLEAENIIYKSNNVGDLDAWAYNIQPWAWDYLNKNPQLLKKRKS